MKCPICGADLLTLPHDNTVLDGNTCFKCEKDSSHKFWRHPFDFETINYNPTVGSTNWDWERAWHIIDEEKSQYLEITQEKKDEIERERIERESKISDREYVVEAMKRVEVEAQDLKVELPPYLKTVIFCELGTMLDVGKRRGDIE